MRTFNPSDPDQNWIQEGRLIRREGTNYCLKASNTYSGSNVYLASCNENDTKQQWEIAWGNLVNLRNTNRCLNAYNRQNGSNLNIYTCEPNDDDQYFDISTSYTPQSGSSQNPGSSCGSGKIYDCSGNCVNDSTAQSWTGDGYCDDGTYGMVLTCSAFDNDGGDCGGSSSSSSPSPGSSCGSGQIYDCSANCVDASTAQDWTGDGWCDDGTYGMVLTCPTFDNDGGDCN